jgi:hypothetical protein
VSPFHGLRHVLRPWHSLEVLTPLVRPPNCGKAHGAAGNRPLRGPGSRAGRSATPRSQSRSPLPTNSPGRTWRPTRPDPHRRRRKRLPTLLNRPPPPPRLPRLRPHRRGRRPRHRAVDRPGRQPTRVQRGSAPSRDLRPVQQLHRRFSRIEAEPAIRINRLSTLENCGRVGVHRRALSAVVARLCGRRWWISLGNPYVY